MLVRLPWLPEIYNEISRHLEVYKVLKDNNYIKGFHEHLLCDLLVER